MNPHLVATAAVLAALLAGVTPRAVAQRPETGPEPLELSEVRRLFERVDADADGRLALREADHGGVGAQDFRRFDADADGRLDADEFVVARHALSASTERRPAQDLVAEATRIQAAWRARRSLERAQGPSAVRLRGQQGLDVERGEAPRDRAAPRAGLGRASASRLAQKVPSYPLEVAGGLPPALGLTRLGGPAVVSGVTLEERARAAQELIEARLQARGGPGRGRLVVQSDAGARASTSGERSAASRPSPRSGPRTTRDPERSTVNGPPPPIGGPAAGRSRSTGRTGGGPR